MGPTLRISDETHAKKYRGPGESFREAANRGASALAEDGDHYHRYRQLLLSMVYLPGGRIQAASGSQRRITAYSCFMSGAIQDNFTERDGIMARATEAAETMRMGGGIGYDFSLLRPRGEIISTLQSPSSGPISFMEIYNAVCHCVHSAGHRRGAQMGVLRVDHPDIEEFVHAKQNGTRFSGFNISVAITDEFMTAVKTKVPFELKWNGKVYSKINAVDLWEKIMRSTWDWAEPGVLFIDTINKRNNLSYCEVIAATNPCFEGDTLIATRSGAYPIKDLIGKEAEVWNGSEWVVCDNFRVTGRNQKMLRLELQDGSELRVTPSHMMLTQRGRIEAAEVKVGDRLDVSMEEYDGNKSTAGAYIKGFFLGDGSEPRPGRAWLGIYEGKEVCKAHLENSLNELPLGNINTSAKVEAGWNTEDTGVVIRETMVGLAPRKTHLLPWIAYRSGLPSEAFLWDRKTKREFLAGYFDADGTSMGDGRYQVTAASRRLLTDIQILLKSIGVKSKVALGSRGGAKIMPGGVYDTKDSWRLSVSQSNSIKLSKELTFSRLKSFSDRKIKYSIRSKMGQVVSIEDVGVDEIVYCCTIPSTHQLQLAIGISTGQCGEQPLPPYGACLLGSFNLPQFLLGEGQFAKFDWDAFSSAIPDVVTAMNNVVDRAIYPLTDQRTEALAKRRMGLGITGLANAGEILGYPYGSDDFIEFETRVLKTLANVAYLSSAISAERAGSFPLFKRDEYLASPFVAALEPGVRDTIAKNGIRNSHLTSIAPTGTISLCADNVSSGIEPVFQLEYTREIQAFDGSTKETVTDYAYRVHGIEGRTSEQCSVEDHLNVLLTAAKWADSGVSKTCNINPDTSWEDFKAIYVKAYEGGAKGCTTFNPNGSRKGILEAVDEGESNCFIDTKTGRPECG